MSESFEFGKRLFPDLHTNQRLLLMELIERKVHVEVLIPELELVEAKFGEHSEFIIDRDSSICPYPGSLIASDKYLSKKLLQRTGVVTPAGEQFFADQKDDALRYAQELEKPIVIKPSHGSHGKGCHTDLQDLTEIEDAIDDTVNFLNEGQAFLVEEQCPGMEMRLFVTKSGDYAALHRDPAYVIGDGKQTIGQLIQAESEFRMNPRTTCLCPIVIDDAVKQYLSLVGLTLNSVPKAQSKVYLRRNSNIAQGGMCEDYTDRIHPSLVEIALNSLKAIHGLQYAGIDILTVDPTKDQNKTRYAVLEVNSNPGVHMHVRPGKGDSQNVASYIADLMFPETKR